VLESGCLVIAEARPGVSTTDLASDADTREDDRNTAILGTISAVSLNEASLLPLLRTGLKHVKGSTGACRIDGNLDGETEIDLSPCEMPWLP